MSFLEVQHLLAKECRRQLLQALNPQDNNFRFQFWVDFQQRLEQDVYAE
jgi:hypothetical protein